MGLQHSYEIDLRGRYNWCWREMGCDRTKKEKKKKTAVRQLCSSGKHCRLMIASKQCNQQKCHTVYLLQMFQIVNESSLISIDNN